MTDASLADRLARLSPEQRAQLSRRIREKATAAKPAGPDPTPSLSSIPRIDRSTGRLPMSHAARRLYFLQKLQPDSPAYNNVEAVRVRGDVRPETVRAALAAVVARHELLRTICAPDGGPGGAGAETSGADGTGTAPDDAEPTLLLVDRQPPVEVVDLGPDGSPADARDLFAEHADRPFDLDREVPLRVTLARLTDDDHALLFVAHHIATDAWSCRLLVREFFEAYRAAAAGTTDERPPPDLQYADFAGWQRRQLHTDAVRGHLDYWRERLAGVPPVLELPLERPRPPVRSDHGAELHLDLDDALRRRLPVAAREAGVTPFALLLTAFGYVLHRHCATEDVVVGIPVSGRDRVELEPLVGCFINTVVLRLDLDLGDDAALSRRDLVRRVWDGMLADLEHQALPFEHLVAELRPERDLSVGQLVQVMVNHYPATELTEPVPGLDVRPLDVPRRRAKFDLTCTVLDGREHTRIVLNYATDLLTGQQADRIGAHLVAVLDALLGDLDASAGTLPPVPPGEAEPATPRVPAGTAVLDRFEHHARNRPERTAVRCPDETVSYGELDRRASRLAGYLDARLPASAPVALLFERSVDYVVAMLAALKAGRTYVPLDPATPPGHLSAVLRACDAGLVLTHAEVDATTRAEVAAGPTPVVTVRDVDAAGPPTGTPRPGTPDTAMYVLFTSGSTGLPKGVVVEHRQFTAYLTSLVGRMGLTDGLDFAIVSTLAADLGLTNLYGALATGGTVHVLPYEWATDPARFAGYFRAHRIDVMKLVPSHLAAIAEAGLLSDVVPARHLVLAGEACPWDLVDAVRAARPGCAVWNHYGPTETTVSVLACPVPATTDPRRGATVPLGFPFDHVGVHVLDRHLRPVPRGAAGELVITGTSVARGYLSPEDDAAGRFVPDPFGTDADARAYRSGDRARIRTDGAVEFLGRLDRQTKIRGYRVEPAYVEAVLRRHPAVSDVAVAVRQDRSDRATLVAYHVPDADGAARPDVPSLTEFARAAMPPYLVPGAWVTLDRLPLTSNGKLDWRALPAPDPGALRAGPAAPPRHARDEEMAALWCEVLGLDGVGIDDDFFDAGGDSFAAMRLARRVGDGLRVVAIFQHPTVRQLVDFLAAADAGGLLHRLPGPGGPTVPATATVVAVPFGGATAAAYRELARALPPEFPLYAVELPGHDVGHPDEPLESFDAIAARCQQEVQRTVRGPVVVYGHCVGAALAYEIARRLAEAGTEVVGVVAGGAFPAPRLPGRLFDLWARIMPSDRWRADRLYRDMLRATGGFTEILDAVEQAFVLRALRHDARESEDLYSRLCHDPAHRPTVPALSVVGERDRITEFHQERYREWDLLCVDSQVAVIPDAGHYFLKHQADQLAGILARWSRTRLGVPTDPDPGPDSGSVSAPTHAVVEPVGPPTSIAAPPTNLRGFALVTLGQLVSLTGSRALAFALGIWVYLQTGSVTQFSGILVTALLPGLLALPFTGAAADRWNRRMLMVVGEGLNAAGTTFCLAMLATGSLHVWHIYLAASLGSIATSFQQPAYIAAIAQLVPKRYLARTNGVVQAVVAVSQAAGPLLGGALVVVIDLAGVMAVDLTTVVVALLTLAVVRFPNLLFRHREESIWSEIVGGVRYIARRRPFVAMIAFFLGFNLILGFALALLPPMVLSFASAGTLSVATMIGAVGGITGGVAMALWGGFERRATGMVGFVALTGAGMIIAGLRPSPVFPVLGLAAIMASVALINGHWQTMIQMKVGMELQGRIVATNRMIANLTEPLGYVCAGLLADAVFEPAMADGGWLGDTVGGVLGTGPGRGMALVVVALGVAQLALVLAGMRWRTLRYMEDALPDAIPGAVVTWDRDALQAEADTLLARKQPATATAPVSG